MMRTYHGLKPAVFWVIVLTSALCVILELVANQVLPHLGVARMLAFWAYHCCLPQSFGVFVCLRSGASSLVIQATPLSQSLRHTFDMAAWLWLSYSLLQLAGMWSSAVQFQSIGAHMNRLLPTTAVKRDWITAGFAHFQPAPYLQR
jgi:hypothetical protein